MKTRPAVLVVVVMAAMLHTAVSIGQTGSGRPAIAVLSVASGFAAQPGTPNPLAGSPLVLFKESFENFLRRKGMFQGPPGSSGNVSPLAAWAYACKTGSPACKQALYEMRPNSVGDVKMDLNGRATFPGAPVGSYYLFAVANYNNQFLVWDLKVDLTPGANSVTLDQRNLAPLDGDQSRAKASSEGNPPGVTSKPCQLADEPRVAKPGSRANSNLSLIGSGYTYTYTKTDRVTGRVLDSFTERGNFSNTILYLLDEDAEQVLQRAGIEPGLLGSRFAMMAFLDGGTQLEDFPAMGAAASILGQGQLMADMAKDAKAHFDCVIKAIRSHSVAEMTTDANARGAFPSVPAGTYSLYGRFYRIMKPVRAGGMFWNLRVELRPGQNTIPLSVDNAAWKAGV